MEWCSATDRQTLDTGSIVGTGVRGREVDMWCDSTHGLTKEADLEGQGRVQGLSSVRDQGRNDHKGEAEKCGDGMSWS